MQMRGPPLKGMYYTGVLAGEDDVFGVVWFRRVACRVVVLESYVFTFEIHRIVNGTCWRVTMEGRKAKGRLTVHGLGVQLFHRSGQKVVMSEKSGEMGG